MKFMFSMLVTFSQLLLFLSSTPTSTSCLPDTHRQVCPRTPPAGCRGTQAGGRGSQARREQDLFFSPFWVWLPTQNPLITFPLQSSSVRKKTRGKGRSPSQAFPGAGRPPHCRTNQAHQVPTSQNWHHDESLGRRFTVTWVPKAVTSS